MLKPRSVILLAGAAIGAALVPLPAAAVERWYSRGVYPLLQRIVTSGSSVVPFALLDLAAVVSIAIWLLLVVRAWRRQGARHSARVAAVSLIAAASALYLLFLALWGLNYRRVPLEAKLAYEASRVTRESAFQLGATSVERLNALHGSNGPSGPDDRLLQQAFADAQLSLGAVAPAVTAPPKRSLLAWYFRRAAIDGMTDPFFLEIILNPEVLPTERPFVLAHEWAHLAGYADESEANFVAWLTCVRGDASAQYSGWLSAYRLASRALPRADRVLLQSRLAPGVIGDFRAIAARLERANPAVSTAARNVYDSYLRANRVEEGIASYDQAVRLIVGTTFENGWVPRLRPPDGARF